MRNRWKSCRRTAEASGLSVLLQDGGEREHTFTRCRQSILHQIAIIYTRGNGISPQNEGAGFFLELVKNLRKKQTQHEWKGYKNKNLCLVILCDVIHSYKPHSAQTWEGCKIYETAQSPGDPSSSPLPAKAEHENCDQADGSSCRRLFCVLRGFNYVFKNASAKWKYLELFFQSARARRLVVHQRKQCLQFLQGDAGYETKNPVWSDWKPFIITGYSMFRHCPVCRKKPT